MMNLDESKFDNKSPLAHMNETKSDNVETLKWNIRNLKNDSILGFAAHRRYLIAS
jgi:hypothetical protein